MSTSDKSMDLLLSNVNKTPRIHGTSSGTAGSDAAARRVRHDGVMKPHVGDEVHVPGMGTGVVREARNRGRYLVEIKGRAIVVDEAELSPAIPKARGHQADSATSPLVDNGARARAPSLDLHGHTVDEAIEALDRFLSDALLAGHVEARVIHGRTGGRIKAAVHARLKQLSSVRRFRLDPTNAGVTLVVF